MKKRTRPNAAYDRGVRIQVTMAPRVSAMLDDLLSTGLFGFNRADVANRLICRALNSPEVRHFWNPTP